MREEAAEEIADHAALFGPDAVVRTQSCTAGHGVMRKLRRMNEWQGHAAATAGHGGLLFAPASLYPRPTAFLVDTTGTPLHSWSHSAHQPDPDDNPPKNLRGWNHVEIDAEGNLYAIVPLQALLKLTPGSSLTWSADVSAHHDLVVDQSGAVLVLGETPRLVTVDDVPLVVLDNLVTQVDVHTGAVVVETSLWDVLRTDPELRRRIERSALMRRDRFTASGWPGTCTDLTRSVVDETLELFSTGSYRGDRRQSLSRLRRLPESPCDVLHTNTLELLAEHPAGLWLHGDILVCMRELNTIAVVDLAHGTVRWQWGVGSISGPHQPSMLPDGRILVFDNGVANRRSRVVIVDPVTREVVWSWTANPPESFFCPLAGGCELLSNGNVLVTNSAAGAAFELTPDKQINWELTLPIDAYGPDRGRVSIYRMSGVRPDVVTRLTRGHDRAVP